MIHGIWTFALCIAVAAVTAVLPTTASNATDTVTYASGTGSGTSCTISQPCAIQVAISTALAPGAGVGRVICLSSVAAPANEGSTIGSNNQTLEMDCPLGFFQFLGFQGTNEVARLSGLNFTNSSFDEEIQFSGSGTLILENCTFVDEASTALSIEPNGPLNLVIRNSRISNSGSGILLKPAAGGSIKATFDHVTIINNNGGGIHTDSSNGPISLDITDSTISDNAGNGFNVTSATSGQNNMVSITRSTIAKNGVAGIQAGGSNAAVLLNATLFDSNANGATAVVNSGRILSYGNNSIIGTAGSGFTGSAMLQ